MLNLRIKLCFLLLITSLNAQNGEIDEFVRTLQENSEKFKFVKVNKRQKAVDFDVNLGDSAVTLPGEGRVDGFRFKVPQGVADLDFVWYFNAPENWGNWYLCPVEGEFETSFTSFLNAVKVYKKFDEAGKADRFRVLQSLSSGYFKEGKEYIMWFRNSEASGVGKVSGRLKFHKAKEKWEHKEIVKALSLEAASLEDQIKELKSVGGKILMDKEFFHLNYANNRVDNVFYSIRRTQRLRGGLFITTEFKVPSCETSPSIAEIRKRYGEPDFILTDTEKKSVRRHTGGHVEEDENTITYYYDYFGFVVEKDDPKEIVQSVDTGANNFANLNSKKLEPSYGHLSMKNLTVFTNGGKEVGRMYYFNEGEKEPLCITAPPVGVYTNEFQKFEYRGEGEWLWSSYFDDGKIAGKAEFKKHQLNGSAEGFYKSGSPRYKVNYKDGLLDGKVFTYNENGDVDEQVFENGKPVENEIR